MKLFAIAVLALLPAFSTPRSAFAEQMSLPPAPGGPTVAEPRMDTSVEQSPAPVTHGAQAFLEPSQADSDCCSVAIKAQQAAYVSARDGKRWEEAHKLALFYFVRAWLYNNEAFEILQSKEGWTNISELKRAQDLYDKADEELAIAVKQKHHMAQVRDCSDKVARNRMLIGPQIKALLEKASK